MIYRIPMDHCGIKKVKITDKGLSCPDHGDMNVVTIVEHENKKIYWFRCIFCHIGAAYDFEPNNEVPEWICDEEKIKNKKDERLIFL